MERFLLKYWWCFPLLLFFTMVGLILLFVSVPTIWETIVFILFLLTLIAIAASWVVLLSHQKWWKSIVSFLFSGFVICLLGLPLMLAAQTGPDGFGKNHPIPEGLDYSLPLEINYNLAQDYWYPEADIDSLNKNTYLQIWGDCGVYRYDFYYDDLPGGEIFLRCYEASENIPLSKSRIYNNTRIRIDPVCHFSKLVDKQRFVISEGDYTDYYAARIEVWYRHGINGKEQKLLEKVYRVEGYMR